MSKPQASSKQLDPLEQVSFGKTVRQQVREFGALFGIIGLVIAGFKAYHGRSVEVIGLWAGIGILFAVLGYLAPGILRPVWAAWMKFAHLLGLVMTTLITSILWTVLLIPMALLLKILGKSVMDLRFRAPVESYWETREQKEHDFKLLENQY